MKKVLALFAAALALALLLACIPFEPPAAEGEGPVITSQNAEPAVTTLMVPAVAEDPCAL